MKHLETYTSEEFEAEVQDLIDQMHAAEWDDVALFRYEFTAASPSEALCSLLSARNVFPPGEISTHFSTPVASYGIGVQVGGVITTDTPNTQQLVGAVNYNRGDPEVQQAVEEVMGILFLESPEAAEARAAEIINTIPSLMREVYRIKQVTLIPVKFEASDG